MICILFIHVSMILTILCALILSEVFAHKIDEGHKHVLHLQDTWDRVFRSRWGSSWWVWKNWGPKAAVVDFSELFIVFKASTGRFCEYFNDRGDRRSFRKHCHGAFGISSFTVRSVRGLVILVIICHYQLYFDVVASAMWVKIQIGY